MKEKIMIAGAGKTGEKVLESISKKFSDQFFLTGFIDNDFNKQKELVKGIPVYSPEAINDIDNVEAVKVFIAVADSCQMNRMATQLKKIGYRNLYYVDGSLNYIVQVKFDEQNNAYPLLDYLETHVMNGCNLKCKGCTHFSNLFETNDAVPFEIFKRDISRLEEVCQIRKLRLMGGEPFLNKRLPEYLEVVHKCFPETDIRLVTNALLILQCEKSWLEIISTYNVCLDISWYIPVHKRKEEIIKRLNEYGVKYYSFLDEIKEFSKCLTLTPDHEPYDSQEQCGQSACCILKNGKIYKCPMAAYISKFNEYFNVNIKTSDYIDIFGKTEEIRKFALDHKTTPIDLCRYCSSKIENYSWGNGNIPMLEDWLIQGER